MKPVVARRLRVIGCVLCGLALVVVAFIAWALHRVQQSLPPLTGERTLAGLAGPATLSRDELGAVSVRAPTAVDAARLLGFAHGQDRFFQMDLLRRHAAGELSALFGPSMIDADRSTRVHRFRELGRVAFDRESPARRELLTAYAEGVNAGLSSLSARPWEYLLLRTEPEPWSPVDSSLVLYSMALELQDPTGRFEHTLMILRSQLGPAAVDFFNPLIGPADGALDHTVAALPPAPSERVINLRQAALAEANTPGPGAGLREPAERPVQGSNAIALAGGRTHNGAGLVAGDPHLSLRVPTTWYRAQLEWTAADGQPVRVVGLSLPGAPGIVIGSNGHVAWSFTNSYVDTGDLVLVDCDPAAPDLVYHRGQDALQFERRTDTIAVKGAEPVTVESTWTVWGPIVGKNERGRPVAFRWTMHDPSAANQEILEFATARSLDELIAIAHRCGIPPQNLVAVDARGDAAWTIVGRLPKRFGFDGRFPVSWTFGDRGWDGFLSPAEVPVLRASRAEAIWSANNRHVGGSALALLGEAGYYEGHRSNQIRDTLMDVGVSADARARSADLLAVQLDIRARWLETWRDVLATSLDEAAVAADHRRAEFRRLLLAEQGEFRAEAGSIAYRLTREWYDRLKILTLQPIFARCIAVDPDFNYNLLRTDAAMWALHRDEPRHLLASTYPTWRDLRLAAVDAAIARLDARGVKLSEATWGERNRAAIRHPLSSALPGPLARWLDLPPQPLAGDYGVPRVQRPTFGVSARIVMAPGHEGEGVLHMPGGQSGHPLSPYYRSGHAAWLAGEPSPLVPGDAAHTLTFTP
jgi:penicillin G amidase